MTGMRLVSVLSVAACGVLAAGLCFAARGPQSLEELRSERDLEKRSRLALEYAHDVLDRAIKTYLEGKQQAGLEMLLEVQQAVELSRLLATVPTLKPQLASATWIGQRRWDLAFSSGETVALPEGEQTAATTLQKFAKMDRSAGLLGRGIKRFDLRIPGKMIVRLPQVPGEPVQTQEIPS